MGARSSGRAVALQVMFGLDALGALEQQSRALLDVDQVLSRYFGSFEDGEAHEEPIDPEARAFAEQLCRDLVSRVDAVDEAIRKASTQWRLERMPRVDRNIVRVAAFELLDRRDTPRAVIIDEAVELAKRYGGDESAAFVNGLLERIADDAGRAEPRRARDDRDDRSDRTDKKKGR
jgi:N utilization substance protein B